MLSSIVSQREDDISSKLFGDFSDGKEINSFASSLWEVSISKPSTSTKPLPIILQLVAVSNIVLTGTLLISQDKILIMMLYNNNIFNTVFFIVY